VINGIAIRKRWHIESRGFSQGAAIPNQHCHCADYVSKKSVTEHELCQIDIFLLEKYRPLLGGLQVKTQQKTLDFTALLRD